MGVFWFPLALNPHYGLRAIRGREHLSSMGPCDIVRTQILYLTRREIAMRLLWAFSLIVLIMFGTTEHGRAQSPDDIRLSVTKDVMDEIAGNQLASVYERFSPDLKDSLSQDKMRAVLDELVAVSGAFQRQISQSTRTVQGTQIYVSKSQFKNFKVELRLAFNGSNQITRVWIAPVSDLSPEDMEASAKALTDLLRQKSFDLLSSRFNDRMKAAMPRERLEASWSHVILHLGQFKSVKLAQKDPELDMVDVRCEFEHGEATVRLAFDPSGKVSGLWMLPVQSEGTDSPQI
jgi:hypothetical protein